MEGAGAAVRGENDDAISVSKLNSTHALSNKTLVEASGPIVMAIAGVRHCRNTAAWIFAVPDVNSMIRFAYAKGG
jgi:hypothetical protein